MNRTSSLWLAGILVLVALAPPAYPQRQPSERELLTDLTRDVLNLRDKLNSLQQSIDTRNDAVLKLVEQVMERFAPLNANIQKLSEAVGGIRTDHATAARDTQDLRKLVDALKTDVGGLNEKLTGLNAGLRSVSEGISTMKVTETPLPSAGAVFAQANSDYSAGIYGVAISEFREFLLQYPKDARAPSAQFYIGKSYGLLKDYPMAIDAYDELLQKYPGSDRTCSALYEKGLTLGVLKRNPEARAVLQQAQKECGAGTEEAARIPAALKALPPK